MKYKVIRTQMNFLHEFIGQTGTLGSIKKSNSLVYYYLHFKNGAGWFLESEIKKEK